MIDPGDLQLFPEKADDVVGTLDKVRRQIADYGTKTDFPPLLVLQDRFGNRAILDGVTRAIRTHQLINGGTKPPKQLVPIVLLIDPSQDFRGLTTVREFPHY